MGMFDWINLRSSKNGDELFEKSRELLGHIGVDVYDEDGSIKDMYTVICEIAAVWNKETK